MAVPRGGWKLHPSSQAWPLLSTSNRGETAIAKCGKFPTFGIRARAALSCEEGMRAAMDATGERSAGRPPYPVWHVYWFLSTSTRDIKLCNDLYLSFFTADDNHLQKSIILSSVMCRYAGHQQSLHQPKFDIFFWKFDREIIWKFCVKRLL